MRLQTNNYADRCGGALFPPPNSKSEMQRVAGGAGLGEKKEKEKKETQEVASVTFCATLTATSLLLLLKALNMARLPADGGI